MDDKKMAFLNMMHGQMMPMNHGMDPYMMMSMMDCPDMDHYGGGGHGGGFVGKPSNPGGGFRPVDGWNSGGSAAGGRPYPPPLPTNPENTAQVTQTKY